MEPIVVTVAYNEAEDLARCLSALGDWATRTTVVDLGSTDETVAVAVRHGARVVNFRRVPFAEAALAEMPDLFPSDQWVLRIDPDETINEDVKQRMTAIAREDAPEPSAYEVPIVYHFAGRQLHGTPWGGEAFRVRYHRWGALRYDGTVHPNLPDYVIGDLGRLSASPLHHRWVDDWDTFREKHSRYAAQEGPSRYARGERYTRSRHLRAVLGATKHALIDRFDPRDGLTGMRLSLGFVNYVHRSHASLRDECRRRSNHSSE